MTTPVQITAWLKRACPKGRARLEARPALLEPISGWASDTVRIHHVIGQPTPAGAPWDKLAAYLDQYRSGPTTIILSCHFAEAVKSVAVFAPGNNKALTISCNGSAELWAKSAALGDILIDLPDGTPAWSKRDKRRDLHSQPSRIIYRKVGPDIIAQFNSAFLLDALSAMGGTVTITFTPHNGGYVAHLTDGTLEALLIGLELGKGIPTKPDFVTLD